MKREHEAAKAEADRLRLEAEAQRRRMEEEDARRRAEMEALRRQQEEELERLRMFQNQPQYPQYAPQPVYVQQPPQVITQTVVVREGSNIGKVSVDVVEVRGLKSHQLLSKHCDPYVVIQVERQKERTRTLHDTNHAIFNERFTFYVSESYATIDLSVWDKTRVPLMKDDHLGKVEIPVKTLQFDVPIESWYPLQPLLAGGVTVHGELFLKILLTKG
jgi:hypothetical protein